MKMNMLFDHEPNMLKDLHQKLISLPISFRSLVCEECNWSIPTFYRKAKMESNKIKVGERTIDTLSNAEKEKIINLFFDCINEMFTYASKYKK